MTERQREAWYFLDFRPALFAKSCKKLDLWGHPMGASAKDRKSIEYENVINEDISVVP